MKAEAIAKARTKLDRLRAALVALKAADEQKNPVAAEQAWTDFIVAASTLYAALEQGAKDNGSSKGWFGRKRHERRTDPLLSYLHHARDVEHHGLQQITGRTNSHITVPPGGAVILQADGKKTWNIVGSSGEIGQPRDLVKLVPVIDARFGTTFDPPQRHLGVDLKDDTPIGVATSGLIYLEAMVAEAAKLPA